MGFWNKLGKIALQAAPYVAAPFTGGASLAFAPATRQAGQMWSQHDANSAAKKGIAPSGFDRYLNMASEGAGMAGGAGAFGKTSPSMSAGNFGSRGGSLGNWQQGVSQILNRMPSGGGGSQYGTPPYIEESGGMTGGGTGGAIPRNPAEGRFGQQMSRQLGPVMGRQDQSNPNLALSLGAGRMEAIKNQPFRSGYNVNTLGEDDKTVTTTRTPRIYPGGRGRKQQQATQ